MSLIPSGQAREIELRRHLRNLTLRESFESWCEYALAPDDLTPAPHHRLLIRELQAIADGTNDRLIVSMPPGSAKSTYASKLFPAWYLARFPKALVIGASHGQDLADDFSGDVQKYVKEYGAELGYGLANKAVDRWRTTAGGVYRAAGTGGSVTGRRADLIIWDDPIRGAKDADSSTVRETTWKWYLSDLRTRLRPKGRMVVILTRWHEADPAGRLLAQMKDGGRAWRVISLPAIAESHDELGRKPGDPLWPDWESLASLNLTRKEVGERVWASLYQQRPTVQEGAIFKRDWWQPHDAPPPRPEAVVLSLDTAYTTNTANDASACTVWHLQRDGHHRSKLLLRYAWRERLELHDLVTYITATLRRIEFCPSSVPVRVLVEAKASGLSVIQELRRLMPGVLIEAVHPSTDKIARAHAVTSLLQGGKVAVLTRDGVPRPWAQMVIDECAVFDKGEHDDLVDSVTMALRWFRDAGLEWFSSDEPEPEQPRDPEPLY